jgi:excisionase family DNA binding protein
LVSLQKPHHSPISEPESGTEGLDDFFDVTATDVTSDTSDLAKKKTRDLTIAQAASALRVSERTIWRWIDGGHIKSFRKSNKRFVRVPLSDLETAEDGSISSVATKEVAGVIDLVAVISQLNAANYRVGWLESRLSAQEEQLKLLPDLQSKAQQTQTLEAQITALQSELQALQRPWWQKIFGQKISSD